MADKSQTAFSLVEAKGRQSIRAEGESPKIEANLPVLDRDCPDVDVSMP